MYNKILIWPDLFKRFAHAPFLKKHVAVQFDGRKQALTKGSKTLGSNFIAIDVYGPDLWGHQLREVKQALNRSEAANHTHLGTRHYSGVPTAGPMPISPKRPAWPV